MPTTWVDFKELRAKLSFAQILKDCGVELKIKGDRASGFCPLPTHQGHRHSPSFSAHLGKGLFHCFGCGAKGNALDFVLMHRGLDPSNSADLRKIALELQDRYGLASEKPKRQAPKAEPPTALAASCTSSRMISRLPAPLVLVVRKRAVAKVLSIGLLVRCRRCECSAGKS